MVLRYFDAPSGDNETQKPFGTFVMDGCNLWRNWSVAVSFSFTLLARTIYLHDSTGLIFNVAGEALAQLSTVGWGNTAFVNLARRVLVRRHHLACRLGRLQLLPCSHCWARALARSRCTESGGVAAACHSSYCVPFGPQMLLIGCGCLTADEERTQMAIWAVAGLHVGAGVGR